MTAEEMKYEFEVISEIIANFNAPGYTDREISTVLTAAQYEVVNKRLSAINPAIKDTIEETEMVGQELGIGVITDTVKSPLITKSEETFDSNSYRIQIPKSSYYILAEQLHYFNSTGETIFKIKPISHSFYMQNYKNTFKRPSEEELWRLRFGRIVKNTASENDEFFEIVFPRDFKLEVPTNAKTFYKLRYFKKPPPIIIASSEYDELTDETLEGVTLKGLQVSYNCTLKTVIHREIVQLAAEKAKAYTDDTKGLQSQQMLEDVIKRKELNK